MVFLPRPGKWINDTVLGRVAVHGLAVRMNGITRLRGKERTKSVWLRIRLYLCISSEAL